MAVSVIPAPMQFGYTLTSPTMITTRAEIVNGGYRKEGRKVIVNLKIKAIQTASNSPQVCTIPAPRVDIALACIDITGGIESAITGAIPCGVKDDGKVYMQNITTNHVYTIMGYYISAS